MKKLLLSFGLLAGFAVAQCPVIVATSSTCGYDPSCIPPDYQGCAITETWVDYCAPGGVWWYQYYYTCTTIAKNRDGSSKKVQVACSPMKKSQPVENSSPWKAASLYGSVPHDSGLMAQRGGLPLFAVKDADKSVGEANKLPAVRISPVAGPSARTVKVSEVRRGSTKF